MTMLYVADVSSWNATASLVFRTDMYIGVWAQKNDISGARDSCAYGYKRQILIMLSVNRRNTQYNFKIII